ncbi:hypothetical protein D9M71_315650 [compost metagenome]
MDGNRLVAGVALMEVVALEHPRHRVLRGQPNEIGWRQLIHPGGVECHFGFCRVQNLEHLSLVGLGVLQHLLASQWRAGGILATGVADHPGEVADQEDDLMPQLLELAQLVDQDSMPKVQVRGGWIETGLDPQRLTALQLGHQFCLDQNLFCTALDQRQLLFDRLHEAAHTDMKKGAVTIQDRAKFTKSARSSATTHRKAATLRLPQRPFGYNLDGYCTPKNPTRHDGFVQELTPIPEKPPAGCQRDCGAAEPDPADFSQQSGRSQENPALTRRGEQR